MRLQSQLTLSHFAVTAISMAIIVIGGLLGYGIYLRSDLPAAWAADVALFYAEDIVAVYGDDNLLTSHEMWEYAFFQVLAVSDAPEIDEWLIVTDRDGTIVASNHYDFAIGEGIENAPPFGTTAEEFAEPDEDTLADLAYYINLSGRHVGNAPIVSEDGVWLGWVYYHGGDEDIAFVQQQVARQAGQVSIGLVLVALLVSGLMGLWMARRFGRKLTALETAATAFATGDRYHRVEATGDDEIGRLGQQFNTMADTIGTQMGELRQLADSNARLAVEAEGLARLEERNRLARDLHDAVKQQLFGLNLTLGSVQSLLDKKPDIARQRIEQVLVQTQDIQVELDQVINQLRPASLTDDGLVPALYALTDQWSSQTGVAVEVKAPEARPLPIAQEQALYRIAQEALQNAGKHAQAQSVVIELDFGRELVTMSVRDNGLGFDENSAEFCGGYGLKNMQERAADHGGTASISSTKGKGTTVSVTLPVEPELQ